MSAVPAPPPGFVLDIPKVPPPPDGFVLDKPQEAPSSAPFNTPADAGKAARAALDMAASRNIPLQTAFDYHTVLGPDPNGQRNAEQQAVYGAMILSAGVAPLDRTDYAIRTRANPAVAAKVSIPLREGVVLEPAEPVGASALDDIHTLEEPPDTKGAVLPWPSTASQFPGHPATVKMMDTYSPAQQKRRAEAQKRIDERKAQALADTVPTADEEKALRVHPVLRAIAAVGGMYRELTTNAKLLAQVEKVASGGPAPSLPVFENIEREYEERYGTPPPIGPAKFYAPGKMSPMALKMIEEFQAMQAAGGDTAKLASPLELYQRYKALAVSDNLAERMVAGLARQTADFKQKEPTNKLIEGAATVGNVVWGLAKFVAAMRMAQKMGPEYEFGPTIAGRGLMALQTVGQGEIASEILGGKTGEGAVQFGGYELGSLAGKIPGPKAVKIVAGILGESFGGAAGIKATDGDDQSVLVGLLLPGVMRILQVPGAVKGARDAKAYADMSLALKEYFRENTPQIPKDKADELARRLVLAQPSIEAPEAPGSKGTPEAPTAQPKPQDSIPPTPAVQDKPVEGEKAVEPKPEGKPAKPTQEDVDRIVTKATKTAATKQRRAIGQQIINIAEDELGEPMDAQTERDLGPLDTGVGGGFDLFRGDWAKPFPAELTEPVAAELTASGQQPTPKNIARVLRDKYHLTENVKGGTGEDYMGESGLSGREYLDRAYTGGHKPTVEEAAEKAKAFLKKYQPGMGEWDEVNIRSRVLTDLHNEMANAEWPMDDLPGEIERRMDVERAKYAGARGGFARIPTAQQLLSPLRAVKRALRAIGDFALRRGLEPAKLAQRAIGREATASIIKGTRGKIDVERERFSQLPLVNQADQTVEKFRQHLDQNYSTRQLEDFMVARTGQPQSAEAMMFARDAEARLPEGLRDPNVKAAMKEMSDYIFDMAQEVAYARGVDLNYFEDYFRGQFEDGAKKLKDFREYWQTTDNWTKRKTLPSPADALQYGLKLRHVNPVENLRSELVSVAGMKAALWQREYAYQNGGDGVYIAADTEANRAAHPDWVKLPQSVFADDIVHPEYAGLHENLTSFNKVTSDPSLSKFRTVANLARSTRLLIPTFHFLNTLKAQVNDAVTLAARSAITKGRSGAKYDRSMTSENPDYADYVEHGGGHRNSAESEASNQLAKVVKDAARWASGNAKLIQAGHAVNLVGRFRGWLFDQYIPKAKFHAYLTRLEIQERQKGRELSAAEKMDTVKAVQNIFGEMNEALFGRSGTMTSATRLWFTAPGYSEGNARVVYDSLFNWNGEQGTSARWFIPMSKILSISVAAIGTALLTGKPKTVPTTAKEWDDASKIDTPWTDESGRPIKIETASFEKQILRLPNRIIGAFWKAKEGEKWTPEIQKIGTETGQQLTGMAGGFAQTMSDLMDVALGKQLVDYQGNMVVKPYDPFFTRVKDLAYYELSHVTPIAMSTWSQARQHKATMAIAAVEALSGFRPTYSEADKDLMKAVHNLYAYKNDFDKVLNTLSSADDPAAVVKDYLAKAHDLIEVLPPVDRPKWERQLRYSEYSELRKKLAGVKMSNRTEEAKVELRKKLLEAAAEWKKPN
jgi:hypothetical protein